MYRVCCEQGLVPGQIKLLVCRRVLTQNSGWLAGLDNSTYWQLAAKR